MSEVLHQTSLVLAVELIAILCAVAGLCALAHRYRDRKRVKRVYLRACRGGRITCNGSDLTFDGGERTRIIRRTSRGDYTLQVEQSDGTVRRLPIRISDLELDEMLLGLRTAVRPTRSRVDDHQPHPASGRSINLVPLPQLRKGAAVSVVIPAMNEERNIGWVLKRLPESVNEVILVDGNSKDDTVAVSRSIRPDIRVVRQDRPGKGAALRAGFAAARGDYIVMIDADRSMDPTEIQRYLDLLDQGHDLVKGSRFLDDGGTTDMELIQRLGNGVLRGLVNGLYRTDFTDLCYGFFAFRRNRLDDLALCSDGFEIETELVVRAIKAGLRIGEVPSFESPRAYGESHMNTWRDGTRVLATLLGHRFRRAAAAGAVELPAWVATQHTFQTPLVVVPAWVLALLSPGEADRCAQEWGAHLHERIQDGQIREARRDRRGFVWRALLLAISSRMQRAFSRSR